MFRKWSIKKEKKELNTYFDNRVNRFFKKKKPKSQNYPYVIHDPFEVIEDDLNYDKFYLIGDSWLEEDKKPIVLVVGCNDWKLGFIADYLKEFRVAFSNRKKVGTHLVSNILSLKIKPEKVIIWGYTESKSLGFFLRFIKIPVWRVEDGFIRSSDLGANHVTPCSLVFDETGGIYYNYGKQSGIEKIYQESSSILNSFDTEKAEFILDLYRSFEISKYNPPLTKLKNTILSQKVVLVIGQVDSDQSIEKGNPNKWSMEDLVLLAVKENPGARVLYRPHPEVHKGFQKSKFSKNRISYFAEIVSPDEHIVCTLSSVDHVYVISSLTGFEALLYGKKVTVVGCPFYAGWGLTDDRYNFSEKRTRELNLIQLFYGAYFLYPRYLPGAEDKNSSVLSAIFNIVADRNKMSSGNIEYFKSQQDRGELLRAIAEKNVTLLTKDGLKYYLNKSKNYYNEVIVFLLLSFCEDESQLKFLLNLFKDVISLDLYGLILKFLWTYKHGEYLYSYYLWLINKDEDYKLFFDFFVDLPVVTVSENKNISYLSIKEKFNTSFDSKDFFSAKLTLRELFLNSSKDYKDLLRKAIYISNITFDYKSCLIISKVLFSIDASYSNSVAVLESFRALSYIKVESNEALEILINLSKFNPDKIFYVEPVIDLYFPNEKELVKKSLELVLDFQKDLDVRKVNAYISLGEYKKAEELAHLICSFDLNEKTLIAYSQALSFNGNVAKSISLIESYIGNNYLSSALATEIMRLCVLSSDYKKSLMYLNRAEIEGIEIGEMHKRKCYFGNDLVRNALLTFKDLNINKVIEKYFPNKYFYNLEDPSLGKNIFFISIFGPGDEIRFASIYKSLGFHFENRSLFFSCSPRLLKVMERSFPNLNFIGVDRPRNGDFVDLENYRNVPGSDIVGVINDNAIEAIEHADSITLVTNMLGDILKSKESFSGKPYLIPDSYIVNRFKSLLPRDKRLVGISWRSSINTSSRNEHYLTIEQLFPLFDLSGVQFVNFQYDDCSEELQKIEYAYPGKVIDLGIDQYNDFDSVSALMVCMDLIITPATTVVELAGALGVKTWLFSNSSELDWRKLDTKGTDIWHSSVEIIDVPEKGNKEKLVDSLLLKLKGFLR